MVQLLKAADDVSLRVKPASVHALVGENGAGKSTLMKCLVGLYTADTGKILIEGQETQIRSISDSLDAGISMIQHELSPVLWRSVMQNIWLGREPLTKLGMIDNAKMREMTSALLKDLGVDIDPLELVGNLTVAKMQLIEIVKAISYHSKIIIMDEPTSSLTIQETELLFQTISRLKQREVEIIYISHRMDEIFRICDFVTVMRDSKHIHTGPLKELAAEDLIQMMVGRQVEQLFPKEEAEIGETVLRVEGLSSGKCFHNVSFDVRKGEIFGIAGLFGTGQTELVETIFGIRAETGGAIYKNGKKLEIKNSEDAIRNGFGFLTEDRRMNCIFGVLSVKENIAVANMDAYLTKTGFVSRSKYESDVKRMADSLRIKAASYEMPIQNLSGGNQQKVLVARWLLTESDILMIDEPTRGIDVGAKAEIHAILSNLAVQVKTIIMVPGELPEIIGMSDWVLVMHEGEAMAILEPKFFTFDNLINLLRQISVNGIVAMGMIAHHHFQRH